MSCSEISARKEMCLTVNYINYVACVAGGIVWVRD